MSADTRLSKLIPALSAKERALLALRAVKAGQDATEFHRSMPSDQRHDYIRYAGLAFVAECQLGSLVHVIKNQIDNLDFDLQHIDLLEKAAARLERDGPSAVATEPVRTVGRRKPVTVPAFLRGLAQESRNYAFQELSVRWQELRAVELVTGEIAVSFDGEDPLHPEVRGWIETSRQQVASVHERLGDRRRLPDPGDDDLEVTRDLIEQGLVALGVTAT